MSARAIDRSSSILEAPARAILASTSNDQAPARASEPATPTEESPARDPLLRLIKDLGYTLDDAERMRIALGNRISALERDHREAPPELTIIYKQLVATEHLAELALKRAWRKHPLAEWAKSQRGVGEKSIARLIAETGDPAERPNPDKLRAYCGHGQAMRRFKGMTQQEALRLGNPVAKKRVWLVATSMLKAGNREIYDKRREQTKDRDWTDGHKHADALRIVGKEFLKELWKVARAGQTSPAARVEIARAGHCPPDAHRNHARAGHSSLGAHTATARAGGEL